MLTDIAIKSLKTKDKPYKVADRDGLYVSVAPTGTKTFRYDSKIAISQQQNTIFSMCYAEKIPSGRQNGLTVF